MKTRQTSPSQLAEEAAEWVLRRMEDRSAECSAKFLRWLKHSPQHIDEYLLAATTHAALRDSPAGRRLRIDLKGLLEDTPANVIRLDLSSDDSAEVALPATATAAPRAPNAWRRVFTLAAAVATLAIGLWGFWAFVLHSNTYVTGVGEQRSVRLADGSMLHLNTRSRVKVNFTEQLREVRLLEGEALFTVAHKSARPFQVLTQTAVVQAVGTEFNVYEHGGEAKVSVLEGRVRVAVRSDAAQSAPALLAAGEEADVGPSGRIVKRVKPDITNTVAWRQRVHVFRAVPLAEVIEQFNRYNENQIHLESEALGRRLIWGVFHVDEPQALIKFLSQDASVEIESISDGLVVRPRSESINQAGSVGQ